jgi:hypothetical protein
MGGVGAEDAADGALKLFDRHLSTRLDQSALFISAGYHLRCLNRLNFTGRKSGVSKK